MFGVVVYPFFYNVVLSFSNMSLRHFKDRHLIGMRQYAEVFKGKIFYVVLFKTLVWTFVNIFFRVTIVVSLALILNRKIFGRAAIRTLLILPWPIPQVIITLTWRSMSNYEYGSINLFIALFLNMSPVGWLGKPLDAFSACIITNVWLGFPFMMTISLGGLQSIPQELYEAADIDGASGWRKFWS